MPAQENEYLLWCCLSDNASVFHAIIRKDATVSELREKIWRGKRNALRDIDPGSHESVGTLKQAIREGKEPELDYLSAERLILWKVRTFRSQS
jgi:hypothetical protein